MGTEAYEDSTSDWAYACRMTDQAPARIEGVMRHENRVYIEAIATSAESNLQYYDLKQDEDGLWSVKWVYTV